MKKLIIDHFSLRSNELKVLKVLEIVYVFCTIALFLVMVNQCGETLTEGSVSVSDVVSITAEGLILFCEVAFLAILQRGLNGVGHQKSLVRCANVLTTVMGLGVVYAILGKFSLLYYGTEDLPDLLDWTAFLSHLFYLVFAFGVFAWVYFHASSKLCTYLRYALLAALLAFIFIVASTWLVLLNFPSLFTAITLTISIAFQTGCFLLLTRMLKYRGNKTDADNTHFDTSFNH